MLSKRCYGKQRCKIIVSSQDFGSPCLPGVAKHLNVSYACGKSKCMVMLKPSFPIKMSHRNKGLRGYASLTELKQHREEGRRVSHFLWYRLMYLRHGKAEFHAVLFLKSQGHGTAKYSTNKDGRKRIAGLQCRSLYRCCILLGMSFFGRGLEQISSASASGDEL